jgi:glycosyltransferase involved in cell wall biosynthesis
MEFFCYILYGFTILFTRDEQDMSTSQQPPEPCHEYELSVILPVYASESIIRQSVLEKLAYLHSLDITFELIVIADGNVEKIQEILGDISDSCLKTEGYPSHKGKGNAVRHGWSMSEGNYISYIDADFDIDLSIIPEMLNTARKTGADIVYPDKYRPDSSVTTTLARRIMSTTYSFLISALFDIKVKDTQTGAKLYKKSLIRKITDSCSVNGYGFELETFIEAKKAGYNNFTDVPVTINKTPRSDKKLEMTLGILRDTWVIARK